MRVLGVFSLFILTACSDPINVGDAASLLSQNEIQAQKTLWATNRAGRGYTIEVYRDCVCVRPADYFFNYRVSTTSGENRILVEAIDNDGNTLLVLPDNPTYYPNLEQIFIYLETQINNGDTVIGSFDELEGYPISLEIGLEEGYEITVTGYF